MRTLELVTAVQTAIAARRRQLQLRDHMIWQEELQRELGHRVQNVLANVSAIYHMTIRQSSSLQDFAASFEGRLSALARVHRELVVSSEPSSVLEIAGLVLAPYRSQSAERIEIRGPSISLVSQIAITFALCLHELATNAAKYGALSVPQGSVSLTWRLKVVESDPKVSLSWIETGGPPVEPPSRRGYGTSFIQSAIEGGMAGTIEFKFRREGLVCEMDVPARIFTMPAEKDGTHPSGNGAHRPVDARIKH